MPRPAAATVTATAVGKSPTDPTRLWILETAVHGAPGDIPTWTRRSHVNTSLPQSAVWGIEGTAQGVAPFRAVKAFRQAWAPLREDMVGMLQRQDGRDTGGGVTALRLEVETRSLAAIPWEFLVQDPEGNGQPFRAARFRYATSTEQPTAWPRPLPRSGGSRTGSGGSSRRTSPSTVSIAPRSARPSALSRRRPGSRRPGRPTRRPALRSTSMCAS